MAHEMTANNIPRKSRPKPWPRELIERLLTKHHQAIGVTICRWVTAEDQFRDLIAVCTLASYEQAPKAMLMHVGNQTLANILLTIANEIDDHGWASDHLIHACKMFDICRENRNLVAHIRLLPLRKDDGELSATTWKETAHGRFKRMNKRIDLNEVREIADEIGVLWEYLYDLEVAVVEGSSNEPAPLPSKPPLPRRRTQTLPEPPPDELLPHPPSQE